VDMKILIVDDEKSVKETLAEIFRVKNFKVLTAEDGQEAVKIFTENDIDFVLMDVQMPNMDGLSAYQQMIKHNSAIKKNKPYIILMTGYSDRIEEITKEGVKAIRKPFDVNEVISLFFEMKREDENLKNSEYFIYPFSSNNHVKF
jgi:DNA-binding response OmpR family regulator